MADPSFTPVVRLTRTRTAAWLATALIAALAGCSSDSSDESSEDAPPGDGVPDGSKGGGRSCALPKLKFDRPPAWAGIMPSGQLEWASEAAMFRTDCATGESKELGPLPAASDRHKIHRHDDGWVIAVYDDPRSSRPSDLLWFDGDLRRVEAARVPTDTIEYIVRVSRAGEVLVRTTSGPSLLAIASPRGLEALDVPLPWVPTEVPFFASKDDFSVMHVPAGGPPTWIRCQGGVLGPEKTIEPLRSFDVPLNRDSLQTRERLFALDAVIENTEQNDFDISLRLHEIDRDGAFVFTSAPISANSTVPALAYELTYWVVRGTGDAVYVGMHGEVKMTFSLRGVDGVDKPVVSAPGAKSPSTSVNNTVIVKLAADGSVQKGAWFDERIDELPTESADAATQAGPDGRLTLLRRSGDGSGDILTLDEDLAPMDAAAGGSGSCAGGYRDDGITDGQAIAFCQSAYHYTCSEKNPQGVTSSCETLRKLSSQAAAKCPYC